MSATLLEMTQDILSAMDSDEVNSISDTTESLQVATAIKDSYNYIIRAIDFPEHYTFFELIATNDINYPHIMFLPDNCDELLSLRYNVMEEDIDETTNMRLLEYKERNEFYELMYWLHSEDVDYVNEVDYPINGDDITTYYRSDRHPEYYTQIDDRTLIFNAVNLTEENTLQKSKTVAYGKLSHEFSMTDNFIPVLNDKQFFLLYNEAKAQCFIELKQQANPVAERRARKGWIRSQKVKDSVQDPYENYSTFMNFGRRR